MKHVMETELALYASGDVSLWRRGIVRLHEGKCERCRELVEAYRSDRLRQLQSADVLPPNLDWDNLAAEMTANIRVGLAAGECVAPQRRKARKERAQKPAHKQNQKPLWVGWRTPALATGMVALLSAAWWLNVPTSQTQAAVEEHGQVVAVSSAGIEVRENGSTVGISRGKLQPVSVSMNVGGSASARYIDADTDQITIASVYSQ